MSSVPNSESVTDSLETLGFDETDSLADLIEAETVNHGSREMEVTDIVHDLAVAQRELEQYRRGALALAASLDDKLAEAEAAGDGERADALRRLKRSAMDVYGRVER
jgi:hypothetical protein